MRSGSLEGGSELAEGDFWQALSAPAIDTTITAVQRFMPERIVPDTSAGNRGELSRAQSNTGRQLNTVGEFGSTVSDSHCDAVSPSTTMRVRFGTASLTP